jgi:hypothetical protein
LERILSLCGYGTGSTIRCKAEDICYDTRLSPFQLASFGTELVQAIHNSDVDKLGKLQAEDKSSLLSLSYPVKQHQQEHAEQQQQMPDDLNELDGNKESAGTCDNNNEPPKIRRVAVPVVDIEDFLQDLEQEYDHPRSSSSPKKTKHEQKVEDDDMNHNITTNAPIFQCLVKHGCDLRVCDGFGRTPLHHCC